MSILLVGIGGAAGGMSRYAISQKLNGLQGYWLPLGTFTVNILGAFLMGLLVAGQPGGLSELIGGSSQFWTHLLADGFLGAFTTFSTFMFEGFNLIKGHQVLNAFIYIVSSTLLGVAGFLLGYSVLL